MTKAVAGRFPAGVHINQTELAILELIGSRSGGTGSAAEVSLREMQTLTSRGIATVRRSCHRLQEQGLIQIEARYLPNGGQLENAYSVTPKGCQVLVGAHPAKASSAA